MAERTRYAAIQTYLSPLRLAVSCLTRTPLMSRDIDPTSQLPVNVLLGLGEPVRLRGPERIHLRVRLRIRVARAEPPRGLWDAQTAAYEYRFSDQDDREILAYHWHPGGQSHVQTPHLHLGPAAEVGRASLLVAHLPTGPVGLHGVLRLAVDSFEVAPVRRDWDQVLAV